MFKNTVLIFFIVACIIFLQYVVILLFNIESVMGESFVDIVKLFVTHLWYLYIPMFAAMLIWTLSKIFNKIGIQKFLEILNKIVIIISVVFFLGVEFLFFIFWGGFKSF